MFDVISNIQYGVNPVMSHLWLMWHKLKIGCILTGNNEKAQKIST